MANWAFGCDSDTNNNSCGNSFYIGRLGYGTTYDPLWNPPSGVTTFSFWNIQGPSDAPSGTTYTAWGQDQATAYYNNWLQNGKGSNATLFGSVSAGSGGWTSTISDNQEVVDGFLNQLAYLTGTEVAATFGLYGSLSSEFQDLLDASNWASPQPIVVWLANVPDTPPDCSGAESEFCSWNKYSIGGYAPVIWQYSQYPDLDVTPYGDQISTGMFYTQAYPGFC